MFASILVPAVYPACHIRNLPPGSSPSTLIDSESEHRLVNNRMFGHPCEMLLFLLGLVPFGFPFINSGFQTAAQRATILETASKHTMGLIRIREVIMIYYRSNNSMTHFTCIYVNPGISIYKTETNLDRNIGCASSYSHCCDVVLSVLFCFCSWVCPISFFSLEKSMK